MDPYHLPQGDNRVSLFSRFDFLLGFDDISLMGEIRSEDKIIVTTISPEKSEIISNILTIQTLFMAHHFVSKLVSKPHH